MNMIWFSGAEKGERHSRQEQQHKSKMEGEKNGHDINGETRIIQFGLG